MNLLRTTQLGVVLFAKWFRGICGLYLSKKSQLFTNNKLARVCRLASFATRKQVRDWKDPDAE